MFDFDVKVTVSPTLLDRFAKLPDKLQKKGATAAARKAMNIVRNHARASARGFDDRDSENAVWKNVVTQNSARGGRRIGGVKMRVGVRGGARYSKDIAAKAGNNPGGYTWYWRFLEFPYADYSSPDPEWLTEALKNNVAAVESTLGRELEAELAKLLPNAATNL